jgi:nitroreductase
MDDEGVLDASDTLEGDPGDDPLDQGIIPADRWSAGERFGTTAAEEEAGESLDQLLAEEEPDVDPYSAADDDRDYETGLRSQPGPDPRAGRLVAEDEGTHEVDESDLVARDVGIDAGAASAEEAAVHVDEESG